MFWCLFSLIRYIVHLRVPSVLIVIGKLIITQCGRDILCVMLLKIKFNDERSYRRNNTAIFDFDRHVCAFLTSFILDRVKLLKILSQSECTYCEDSCSIPVIWN